MSIAIDKRTLEIAVKYDQTRQEINKVTDELSEQNKVLKQLQKEKKAAEKRHRNNPEAQELKEINEKYEQQKMKIDQLEKKKAELRRSLGVEGLSLRELRSELQHYNNQLANLTPGTKAFNETKAHVDALKARMKELNGQAESTLSTMRKKFEKFNVFGFAFGGIKEIASTVWSAVKNVATEWYNYNKAMAEATRLTREFLGITGSELSAMTAEIKATADVWGKEYKETLEAVDTLTSQYGITAQQALKIVQDGFQSGADLNNNMIAKIRQFAPAFHDAGIGASELVAIIQQTRSGIFSEEGMNLISMAAKKIREMSSATESSLQAVNIDTQLMQQQLSEGSITMMDAIRQVSAKLKELPPNSQQVGEVLKDVFGRQGAAAGLEMIKSLEQMDTDLANLTGTTGEYGRQQAELVKTQTELNEKTAALFSTGEDGWEKMTGMVKVLATKVLVWLIDGLIQVTNYVIGLYNDSMTLRVAWVALKTVFSTVFSLLAAGFAVVKEAIGGVIGMVAGAVVALEGLLTLDFSKAKQGLVSFGSAIKDFVSDTFNAFDGIGQKWGNQLSSDIDNINTKLKPITVPVRTETIPANTLPKKGKQDILPHKQTPESTSSSSASSNGTPGNTSDKDVFRQALSERELAFRQYNNELKKMRIDNLISEKDFQDESRMAELKFLAEKIALQDKYGQDSTQTQGQYLDQMARVAEEKHKEQLVQFQKEADERKSALEQEYAQRLAMATSADEQFGILHDMQNAGIISYQQAEQERTRILQEQEQIRHDIRQQFVNQANELLQSAQSYFNAMQGREESRVDAKYKKLIAAAKKQGKNTTKLEEQQEAEKAAIKKKYAQKEFRMNVLKILADTATGIAALWKNPGYPWAIPLTALVAAQGAMQLATAKAQQEQAAGLYGGGFSEDAEGFTADGNPKDVAGMIPVHKREFVINHKALQNPAVMEVAKTIDSYQKAGRPDMINSTALLRAAAMGGGLADGGFSQGTGSSTSSAAALGLTAEQSRVLEDCREYLRIISEDRGVTIRDVRRKIREEELMETRASR